MLYFITTNGLVSEETVAKYFVENLYSLQPFVEIPIMKIQNSVDISVGVYDFSNDTKYYHPISVGHVIIRNINKTIIRDRGCAANNKIYYKFILEWETIDNCFIKEFSFSFIEDYFKFEDVFSKIIPFINYCISNNDKCLYQHLVVIVRLMGIHDGLNALLNPQITNNHKSYHLVRKFNLGYEFRTMKVSRHYSYQYRVGRDDRESESIEIFFEPTQNAFETTNIDKSYLQKLLLFTLDRLYNVPIHVESYMGKFIYTFEAWHDYNYGPSKENYTIENDISLKENIISEINKTYELFHNEFIASFKSLFGNK